MKIGIEFKHPAYDVRDAKYFQIVEKSCLAGVLAGGVIERLREKVMRTSVGIIN